MSESSYQQLAKVHQLMEEEDYGKALLKLDALRPRVKRNRYESAVVLQTYGYLYTAMGQYGSAIEVIQDSLALKSLPQAAKQKLLYLSAQLLVAEADYLGALANLTQWFAEEKTVQPEPHALAGVVYAKLKDYPMAIEHLELAVNASEEPNELHRRQLLAVYLEGRRYQNAAELQQQLIARDPNKSADWLQLSAIYRELGDQRKSLAVLELAYQQGLLISESDLLALVNFYITLDAPCDAAKLLTTSLQQGVVTSTRDNWELLAVAWSRARETTKSIQALTQAAVLDDDPQLHLKRAQLAAAGNDWEQVIIAVEAALQIGILAKPGEAHLLAGIAHYQLGEIAAARDDLAQAEDHSATRTQARHWLEYLTHNID